MGDLQICSAGLNLKKKLLNLPFKLADSLRLTTISVNNGKDKAQYFNSLTKI